MIDKFSSDNLFNKKKFVTLRNSFLGSFEMSVRVNNSHSAIDKNLEYNSTNIST